MSPDSHERRRVIVRRELADAVTDVCAERGFERTPVDELARAVGISRATFFRYFESKEDAVVTAIQTGGASLADQLRSSAPAPGTPVYAAIRATMAPTVEAARHDPDRLRDRIGMIAQTPSLRARLASTRADERDALEDAAQELVDDRVSGRAVAGMAMAAIDLAWKIWTDDPACDFDRALDEAFAAVFASADTVVVER